MGFPQPHSTKGAARPWLIGFLCLLVVVSLVWAIYLQQTVFYRHLPIMQSAHAIKADIVRVHLGFEEFLSQNHQEETTAITDFRQRLDQSQRDISALLTGPKGVLWRVLPFQNLRIQMQVNDLSQKMASWRQLFEQRVISANLPNVASQLDQRFDSQFTEIDLLLSTIIDELQALSLTQMKKIRWAQFCLLAIGLLLTYLVITLFKQLIHGRLSEACSAQEQTLKRLAEMKTLSVLGRLFTVGSSPKEIAQVALQEIVHLLSPDVASIYLREGDAMTLLLSTVKALLTKVCFPIKRRLANAFVAWLHRDSRYFLIISTVINGVHLMNARMRDLIPLLHFRYFQGNRSSEFSGLAF